MADTAAPPATTLPAYVEYPSAQTLPGPIAFTGLTMSAFLLPADMAVLRALCQSLISTPSGGQVSFTPLLPVVMMSFTAFPQGVFVNFPDRGRATERELSFGIPGIYAGAGALGFGLLMPFLFLDNPVAMLTGRENYGYFKQWGEITLPGDGMQQAFSAEVYGCPAFAPTAQWGRQGLVALNNPQAVRAHAKSGLPPASVAGAAAWLRDRIVAGSGTDPGAFTALLQGKLTQIFLKQFRDVADGTRACYQAVTRADYTVTKLASLLPEADYDYAFQALQSTPVAESLGIAPSGRTGLGLAITMDMQLETGSVLWQA